MRVLKYINCSGYEKTSYPFGVGRAETAQLRGNRLIGQDCRFGRDIYNPEQRKVSAYRKG